MGPGFPLDHLAVAAKAFELSPLPGFPQGWSGGGALGSSTVRRSHPPSAGAPLNFSPSVARATQRRAAGTPGIPRPPAGNRVCRHPTQRGAQGGRRESETAPLPRSAPHLESGHRRLCAGRGRPCHGHCSRHPAPGAREPRGEGAGVGGRGALLSPRGAAAAGELSERGLPGLRGRRWPSSSTAWRDRAGAARPKRARDSEGIRFSATTKHQPEDDRYLRTKGAPKDTGAG